MLLTMAKSGEATCIRKITGKDETKRHLENLGLVVGEDVMVVTEMAGNLIINIKGARVALDKAMANRIII